MHIRTKLGKTKRLTQAHNQSMYCMRNKEQSANEYTTHISFYYKDIGV